MRLFDILGPVMVGPSSSHTAGAVRIGLAARKLLGEPPVQAAIGLHGSFALTGHGHGTDCALIAACWGCSRMISAYHTASRWQPNRGCTTPLKRSSCAAHTPIPPACS